MANNNYYSLHVEPGDEVLLRDGRRVRVDYIVRPFPGCPAREIIMFTDAGQIPVTELAHYGPRAALSWGNTEWQILDMLKTWNDLRDPPMLPAFWDAKRNLWAVLSDDGNALDYVNEAVHDALEVLHNTQFKRR